MYYLLPHTKQIKYDSSISDIVFLSLLNHTCTIPRTCWDNVKVKTFFAVSWYGVDKQYIKTSAFWDIYREGRVSFMIYLHIC